MLEIRKAAYLIVHENLEFFAIYNFIHNNTLCPIVSVGHLFQRALIDTAKNMRERT